MLIKKTKIPFLAILTVGLLPSFLKKMYYRLKGYKIDKGVRIGIGSVILGKKVTIAKGVKIGFGSVIRANEINIERFSSIGSFSIIDTGKLRIGEDSRINEQVIIGGTKTPKSSLDLGKRTIIMEYSFINTSMPIIIGDDSGIGGHCLLFTHGSWLNQLEGFPVDFAPITIGKKVWLPWRVFITPGVEIGDNVVVGANSLINKSVPSNCMVAGSPAKVLRENYPPPISEERVLEIFNGFITDFIEFLIFNNVLVKEYVNGENRIIEGQLKGNKHIIYIIQDHNQDLYFESVDSVVISKILNNGFNPTIESSKNRMVLDIINKTRIGNSDIGDEFVKFVSRYGLRFDRLD
jgi:acetyltransferase-like isoleucine patch superfamily enzyme